MDILVTTGLVINFLLLLYLVRASRILGTKISNANRKIVSRSQLAQELAKSEKQNYQQLESYLQLLSLLDLKRPLPSTRSFAASPDPLLELIGIVRRRQPSFVVELGSGISTLVIGKQIDERTRFLSIDDSTEFASMTRELLREHEVGNVDLVVAPLRGEKNWYDINVLEDVKDVDLLFIDGPAQSSSPDARHSASFFLERLSPKATVVIDDAKRKSEKRMALIFASRMPNHVLRFLDHEKGTAVIEPRA